MGDDSPLKPVKRRSRDSLEFVGAPRRSLFGQYNNRSASANATSVQLYSSTPPDSDIQASAQAKPIYQAPVRIDRTGLEGLNNQDIAELTEDVVSQDLNDLLDEDADDGSILRDIPTSHIKRSKTKKPRLDAQGNLVPVEPRHKKLRLIFGLVGKIGRAHV